MVNSNRSDGCLTIIARPNLSASWRTNKYLMGLVGGVSLVIALGFTALGAWPVLPFAGLEIASLTAALYYASWKLQYRHVITLQADVVSVEKGYYSATERATMARNATGLSVLDDGHPTRGPELSLHDRNCHIRIGEFLNRDEREQLLGLLRSELRLRAHSPGMHREF